MRGGGATRSLTVFTVRPQRGASRKQHTTRQERSCLYVAAVQEGEGKEGEKGRKEGACP